MSLNMDQDKLSLDAKNKHSEALRSRWSFAKELQNWVMFKITQYNKNAEVSQLESYELKCSAETKITLLDIPPEVFKIIIYFVYRSNVSIVPLITCCRQFYNSFAYLIYATKIVHIRDDGVRKISSLSASQATSTLRYLNKNKENTAAHIPILSIYFKVSLFALERQSLNTILLFNTLPDMRNLVVLTIEADEPKVLFQVFSHLPSKLQVLRIYSRIRKSQISNIDPNAFPPNDVNSISRVPDLQYFEIDCRKYSLVSLHIHPQLGSFSAAPELGEEVTSDRFFRSQLMRFYKNKFQNGNIRTTIKDKIGQTIYNFLLKNRFRLIKLEFTGIDLSLVFNTGKHRRPFKFQDLRMLFFDNNSRLFLTKWLPLFQQANQEPNFRNHSPLLVFYDRLGQRLYFKDTRMIDPNEHNEVGISEIERWRFSDQVASAYATLNRKRCINY